MTDVQREEIEAIAWIVGAQELLDLIELRHQEIMAELVDATPAEQQRLTAEGDDLWERGRELAEEIVLEYGG